MAELRVEDPDDPRLREYLGLRDHELRQVREQPGGDMAGVLVADGDVVASRAATAGYRLRSVLVDGARARPLPEALLVAADDAGADIYRVGGAVLERVTGRARHRECLASFDRRPPPSVASVVGAARGLVALEAVVNPTNVGVICRSAAALGAGGLLLGPGSCDPLYRRASRVSMGAAFVLPHAWTAPFPAGLDEARRAGFVVVALTPGASAVPLDELSPRLGDRVVLVLGTEGEGLREATSAAADHRARVPLHHGIDSLNVGAAAAIACYELFTRRR